MKSTCVSISVVLLLFVYSVVLVLAIETSCDDTSLALVRYEKDTFSVSRMLSYSQVKTHASYGGVVPEIASREHAQQILHVLYHLIIGDTIEIQDIQYEPDELWKSLTSQQLHDFFSSIDSIAVTTTPWLPGSLAVGRSVWYFLSQKFAKPLLPVNHIHGHICSLFLERKIQEIQLPMMVLTVSGGHNELYLVDHKQDILSKDYTDLWALQIKKIGQTLDDAAGESFDKVARMLGWPYPWGPWVEKKAKDGQSRPGLSFTRSFLRKDSYDFSFSGMKSQVYRICEQYQKDNITMTEQDIADIAYEFQEAVVEVLAKKLVKAGIAYQVKTIAVAGGVSASARLVDTIQEYLQSRKSKKNPSTPWSESIPVFLWPPAQRRYCTDNAAMIGVAGMMKNIIVP